MERLNLTTCTKDELEERITRAIKKIKNGMLYIAFGSKYNEVKDQVLYLSREGWEIGTMASLEINNGECVDIINHMEEYDYKSTFRWLINDLYNYIKYEYQ